MKIIVTNLFLFFLNTFEQMVQRFVKSAVEIDLDYGLHLLLEIFVHFSVIRFQLLQKKKKLKMSISIIISSSGIAYKSTRQFVRRFMYIFS